MANPKRPPKRRAAVRTDIVALFILCLLFGFLLVAVGLAHHRCVENPRDTLKAACAREGGSEKLCKRLMGENHP